MSKFNKKSDAKYCRSKLFEILSGTQMNYRSFLLMRRGSVKTQMVFFGPECIMKLLHFSRHQH